MSVGVLLITAVVGDDCYVVCHSTTTAECDVCYDTDDDGAPDYKSLDGTCDYYVDCHVMMPSAAEAS